MTPCGIAGTTPCDRVVMPPALAPRAGPSASAGDELAGAGDWPGERAVEYGLAAGTGDGWLPAGGRTAAWNGEAATACAGANSCAAGASAPFSGLDATAGTGAGADLASRPC